MCICLYIYIYIYIYIYTSCMYTYMILNQPSSTIYIYHVTSFARNKTWTSRGHGHWISRKYHRVMMYMIGKYSDSVHVVILCTYIHICTSLFWLLKHPMMTVFLIGKSSYIFWICGHRMIHPRYPEDFRMAVVMNLYPTDPISPILA